MYRRLDAVSTELAQLGLMHLAQQDLVLRALLKNTDAEDLKTFASVLEPASFRERYGRHDGSLPDAREHFVDAVRPDPPARRQFDRLVNAYLIAPTRSLSEQQLLEARFHALAVCSPSVMRKVNASPDLQELRTRATHLPELATLGLQAVGALATESAMSSEWHTQALALIAEAEKPSANVHFVFLLPLKSLVIAVKR